MSKVFARRAVGTGRLWEPEATGVPVFMVMWSHRWVPPQIAAAGVPNSVDGPCGHNPSAAPPQPCTTIGHDQLELASFQDMLIAIH